MIKARGIIFIAAAIVVAFFAATMVSRYFNRPVSREARLVVVAGADISPGDRLTAEKLKTVKWPKSDVPQGSFNSFGKVVGRVAASSIHEDEPINEKQLVPQGKFTGSYLAARIEPGMRAISMTIDKESGVSGMLKPGDVVDVIASGSLPGRKGGRISRLILTGVKVLAVDYKEKAGIKKKASLKGTAILLLNREDAPVLAASEGAKLRLIARNRSAESPENRDAVVFSATIGPKKISELRAMTREKDKAFNKQIEKGKRAVTFTFKDDDGICGFLRPGNRVDIIATCEKADVNVEGYESGSEARYMKTSMISMLILQNIKVLAVNQEAEKEDFPDAEEEKLNLLSKGFEQIKAALKNSRDEEKSSYKKQCFASTRHRDGEEDGKKAKDKNEAGTVAFLLTPKEAEKLLVASETYNIKIIARNYDDDNIVETKGHTIQSCFFRKKGDLSYEVEFYRGKHEGIIPFSGKRMEETNSSEDEPFRRDENPVRGDQL
ncbi:MAG: Flp pilus assembly protein CpaB [Syntrophobacterales bacterium]|nr:Flp pilus assembly protein CpaB [Syntrophobacterales bacterium]